MPACRLAAPPLWPFLVAPNTLRLQAPRDRSDAQSRGVPAQMIFDECRYEIIAVVVAGPAAEQQWNCRLRAGALQQFGTELFGQELIGIAVIDQQIGKTRAVLDEGDSIVPAPGRAVMAEISAQGLDAPRHLRRRDNRRKRAGGAIATGMAQGNRECAVATHRMPEDRLALGVNWKLRSHQFGKLFRHIAPHAVILRKWRLRGIDIKAGAQPEIIGPGGVTGHAFAARAGVRRNKYQAEFSARFPKFALLRHVGVAAGQARQIPD